MHDGLGCCESSLRRVHQNPINQVDQSRVPRTEHRPPLDRFDSGELGVFLHVIVPVHLQHVLLGRRAQHLDDLDQLVDLRVTQERWDTVDHFHEYAPSRPHVDLRSVVSGPENQLGSTIAPRADVGQVGLSHD